MTKRSMVIAGHKTSISLEDEFWEAFKRLATARGLTLSALVEEIRSRRKPNANLSSAIRVHLLNAFRESAG